MFVAFLDFTGIFIIIRKRCHNFLIYRKFEGKLFLSVWPSHVPGLVGEGNTL